MDDELAEAHQAMGLVRFMFQWDFAAAEREFRRAIALNPSAGLAHAALGVLLSGVGGPDEAIAEATHARALEPVSPLIGFWISVVFWTLRRTPDEVLEECARVISLDPGFAPPFWGQAISLSHLRRHDEAIDAAERAVALSQRQSFFLGVAASTYAVAGRRREAETLLDELRERRRRGAYVSPLPFADVATALGDFDDAFAWLDRACEARTAFLSWIGVLEHYDPLRGDPRFGPLLKKAGLERVVPASDRR